MTLVKDKLCAALYEVQREDFPLLYETNGRLTLDLSSGDSYLKTWKLPLEFTPL